MLPGKRIILLCLLLHAFLCAHGLAPDTVWTIHRHGEHHHAAANEIWLSADRPGAGTGSEVLGKGRIQWESGFELAHMQDLHLLTAPSTLFRFGLHRRAELRLEYTGVAAFRGRDSKSAQALSRPAYEPAPLSVGTKLLLCDHHAGKLDLLWMPRTALMLNLGLPLTPDMAKDMPVSGTIDLLCEHEVTEWLSIGYDVGAHWTDWAPAPDIFASLCINFEPTDYLGLFVESYNIFDTDAVRTPANTRYTHYDLCLDFGITYAVHPRVQLDVNAGFNLYNSEPLLSSPRNLATVGLGVTWLVWHP